MGRVATAWRADRWRLVADGLWIVGWLGLGAAFADDSQWLAVALGLVVGVGDLGRVLRGGRVRDLAEVSTADGPRLPEVEARDRRVLWVATAVGVACIVFGLVWLATHLDHPAQPLVLIPIATGLPRVGHTFGVLNERWRVRHG